MLRPVPHRISFPFNAVYNFSWRSPLRWLTGKRHAGTDFASPTGTPVKAPCDMQQVEVNHHRSGYGTHVKAVSTDGKWILIFAHLSTIGIERKGKIWKQGQVFAWTGNTGSSSNPHLHFEVRSITGGLIDPMAWLKLSQSNLEPLRASINQFFRELFGREPEQEDNDYFLSRIGKKGQIGINTKDRLIRVMKYWNSRGKERWDQEKKKVLK